MKIEWQYLCLEILIGYIQLKLEANEKQKGHEIFEHLSVASQTFGDRMNRNLNGLTVDEKSVFENRMLMDFDSVMLLWQRVTHSMRILAEQGVGYFMERLKSEDLGIVADHLEETFPEIFKYTHKA